MSYLAVVVIAVVVAGFLKLFYWMVIEHLLTEDIRADEVHWVSTEDGWKIRLCRYRPIGGAGTPVLLCHGAFGNQFNFTSPRGYSLVDALVERGYDCWVIDFRGNRSARPPRGFRRWQARMDDYILKDAPAAVDYILETTACNKVHWVGHSLGGMILYSYALTAGTDKIASGVTLATPPGFHRVSLKRRRYLLRTLKRLPRVTETSLRAFSPWLPFLRPAHSILPVNWENMHPKSGAGTFFNLIESLPYDVALQLSTWSWDNTWRIKEGTIDVAKALDKIDLPLFSIYGIRDPFIPERNARSFFKSLPNPDRRYLMLSRRYGCSADYDHVDLAFGRHSREEVYLPIADWLDEHPIRGRKASAEFDEQDGAVVKKKRLVAAPKKKVALKAVKSNKKKDATKGVNATPQSKPVRAKTKKGAAPKKRTAKKTPKVKGAKRRSRK